MEVQDIYCLECDDDFEVIKPSSKQTIKLSDGKSKANGGSYIHLKEFKCPNCSTFALEIEIDKTEGMIYYRRGEDWRAM